MIKREKLKNETKAIIFDILGVLRENIDIKDFWKNKKGSNKLRYDFGTGKLTIKQFAKRGGEMLNLPEKEFLKEHKKAYGNLRLKEDVFKTLKKIKTKKYILSDTNPLHTFYERKKYSQIFKHVHKTFLSQKIGTRKDKINTFKYVIKRIKGQTRRSYND